MSKRVTGQGITCCRVKTSVPCIQGRRVNRYTTGESTVHEADLDIPQVLHHPNLGVTVKSGAQPFSTPEPHGFDVSHRKREKLWIRDWRAACDFELHTITHAHEENFSSAEGDPLKGV